jgi:hypothetical protein
MRRREFLGCVGGAMAWPAVARAQQQTMPMIGFLSGRSPEDSKLHLDGFLRGLGAFGYIDGKTAKVEYRWANGHYDQLRKLAGELTALHPAILVAAGGAPSARAAKFGHDIHPHHFCGWRFRERGDCHESQPARREHHGRRLDERRTYRKAARLAGAAPSGRHAYWFSDQ